MFEKSRKRLGLLLSLIILVPIVVMVIFGIFFSDYVTIGIIIVLVVEVLLVIAYIEAKKVHKKMLAEMKKYSGLKEYLKEEGQKAHQKRREDFIKEKNKHNMMDDLYFGKDEDRENDYMKKEVTNLEIFGNYVANMDKNLFLEELKKLAKDIDLQTLFYKAEVNKEVLDDLVDPKYKISKVNAIKLALALHLSYLEANQLLSKANYLLDKERPFDLAIAYFLENNLSDLKFINLALLENDLEEI